MLGRAGMRTCADDHLRMRRRRTYIRPRLTYRRTWRNLRGVFIVGMV